MCYEALIEGEATEKPLAKLLRGELSSALTNGAVAAAVVLAVLLAGQTTLLLAGGAAVGALLLGVVLHQALLVGGVALLRWRAGRTGPTPETA